MDKITIKKSPKADTRTCDFKKVSKVELMNSTMMHRADVQKGINAIRLMLFTAMMNHNHTKISGIDQFYEDFKTGFKSTVWWENHVKEERHHLSAHVPDDVDLVDVIEFLVDGVMAGMARSGKYRKEELPEGLLQKAFDNTVNKMVEAIEVE